MQSILIQRRRQAALFQVHPEITYREGLSGWEKLPLQDK